jgi:hypothetical protein
VKARRAVGAPVPALLDAAGLVPVSGGLTRVEDVPARPVRCEMPGGTTSNPTPPTRPRPRADRPRVDGR